METNFSKSHEEMQLERINTVAEPKGWWHKEVEELKQQLAAEEEKKHMAMDLCKGYLDELAAALVAIKLKDKALELIALDDCCTSPAPIAQEALAIQPDDSALKAWLGEPVAWRYESATGVYRYRGYVENFDTDYKLLKPIPLYAPKGMK